MEGVDAMINEYDLKDFPGSPLSLDDYQEKAGKYQSKTAPPEERVLGILEEAGEVAGVFKRVLRGDYSPAEAEAKLKKELGDVLWYLSRVAADNGWKLAQVAAENLDKLESRLTRNVIIGSGDER